MRALLLCLLLTGCATKFSGTCVIPQMGQTDSGMAAVRVVCEAE